MSAKKRDAAAAIEERMAAMVERSREQKREARPIHKRTWRDVRRVPIELIRTNPGQPRVEFADDEIEKLAASMEELGLIQPVVVIETKPEEEYHLVSGERRLRAAKHLGWDSIEAVVYPPDIAPKDQDLVAVVENLNRVDLSPAEVARSVLDLFRRRGLVETKEDLRFRINRIRKGRIEDQEEREAAKLLDTLGISADHFRKRALKTLFWPNELVEGINSGKLSFEAASVVASAEGDEGLYGELLGAAMGGATAVQLRRLRRERRRERRAREIPESRKASYFRMVSAAKALERTLDSKRRSRLEELMSEIAELLKDQTGSG